MNFDIGMAIEIFNNLFQATYFIGFIYLFLEKPQGKMRNILSFAVTVLLVFTVSNYYTYHELTFNHSDVFFLVAIMLMYSLFCLKGKLYLRIILPFITELISGLAGFGLASLFSAVGNRPFVEALTFSTSYRYMFMVTGHSLVLLAYFLILVFVKNRIHLRSGYEYVAFIFIPLLSMAGAYSVEIAFEKSDFKASILPYLIISISVFIVTVVIYLAMMLKISKDNDIKTALLLSNQREEMYKTSVLETNEQIEKMSKVKHDMKNSLKSIKMLMQDGQYEQAIQLCSEESDTLSRLYTPVSTSNPTLNAIMNVELDKAYAAGIDFAYNIGDSLEAISASDIVSIIGNLCDNAIEYLCASDTTQRKMSLEINVKKDYRIIICKNTIRGSVLHHNPSLKTTKSDSSLHGKGMNILKEITSKYHGEMAISESGGMIEIRLILQS